MTHFDATTDPIRSHDITDAAPKQKRKRAMTFASGIALVGVAGAGLASTASAATSTSSSSASSVLAKIKSCESGGNYQAVNASSGASGAYQFLNSTWKGLSASAGYTTAASAPASVQDAAALELYNQAGTSPWAASSSCWSSMTSAPTTTSSSTSTSSSTNTSAASDTSTSAAKSTSASTSTTTVSRSTARTSGTTTVSRSTARTSGTSTSATKATGVSTAAHPGKAAPKPHKPAPASRDAQQPAAHKPAPAQHDKPGEKATPQPEPMTIKHAKTAPKPAHAKAAPKPHGKDANKALPKAEPAGKHHAKVAPKPLKKPANSLAAHGSHAPMKAAA